MIDIDLQVCSNSQITSSRTNILSVLVASSQGFSHMTTMDGASFTANAVGEFWLIKTVGNVGNKHFNLQARTNKKSGGAYFAGFSMQGGSAPTVEVCTVLFEIRVRAIEIFCKLVIID